MSEIPHFMIKILDGKKLADKILAGLKQKIKKAKLKLTLAVVLVGDNAVSEKFIEQKKIACEKAGIKFELFKFSAKIKNPNLKKEIEKIIKRTAVSGVILQLPLPKKFIPEEFLNLIPEVH